MLSTYLEELQEFTDSNKDNKQCYDEGFFTLLWLIGGARECGPSRVRVGYIDEFTKINLFEVNKLTLLRNENV